MRTERLDPEIRKWLDALDYDGLEHHTWEGTLAAIEAYGRRCARSGDVEWALSDEQVAGVAHDELYCGEVKDG